GFPGAVAPPQPRPPASAKAADQTSRSSASVPAGARGALMCTQRNAPPTRLIPELPKAGARRTKPGHGARGLTKLASFYSAIRRPDAIIATVRHDHRRNFITDHVRDVKILLANPEPSTHGTSAKSPDSFGTPLTAA